MSLPCEPSRPKRSPNRARRSLAGALLGAALVLLPGAGPSPRAADQDAPAAPALHGTQLRNLPAPAFDLPLVSGGRTDLTRYSGYILVLHFFGAGDDDLLREMAFFHEQGREREIAYLGVSSLSREATAALAKRLGIRHDLALDADGSVTRTYLGDKTTGLFILDDHGTVRLVREEFRPDLRESIRAMLSQLLKELAADLRSSPRADLVWRSPPAAPVFAGKDLEGKPRRSEDYRGKPLLLYFMEHDCDQCDKIASQVSEVYLRYRRRISFLAVATGDPEGDLAQRMAVQGIPFPLLLDPEHTVRRSYGTLRGSPDFIWVDAEGNVRWREFGAPDHIGRLLKLEAQVLLGEARPESLSPTEYVGFRTCRVCHEPEFRDWLRTPHATALVSLDSGKQWHRPECVSCHVTGYGDPSGYQDLSDAAMVHVQCESCHGAGGGHGLPEGTKPSPASASCVGCHRGQYELRQDLTTSVAWMNHHDTPDASTLFAYRPQNITEMERLDRARLAAMTFQAGSEYAGSESCASCHRKIFDAWKGSPHGHAMDALDAGGKRATAECLACHTTGYGVLSGYRGPGTPALAGVGCESCHGPAADHVAAGAQASADSIYGLRSGCPTCRTEAVCRTCHDADNDPDFRMPADAAAAAHPVAGR